MNLALNVPDPRLVRSGEHSKRLTRTSSVWRTALTVQPGAEVRRARLRGDRRPVAFLHEARGAAGPGGPSANRSGGEPTATRTGTNVRVGVTRILPRVDPPRCGSPRSGQREPQGYRGPSPASPAATRGWFPVRRRSGRARRCLPRTRAHGRAARPSASRAARSPGCSRSVEPSSSVVITAARAPAPKLVVGRDPLDVGVRPGSVRRGRQPRRDR